MKKHFKNSKRVIFVITMFLAHFNALSQETEYVLNNGIYFEVKPDTSNPYRYTEDNTVYKAGNIYYFSYTFIDTTGKEFLYRYLPNGDPFNRLWELIPKNQATDTTIVTIEMGVPINLADFRRDPSYNQTIIKYDYIPLKNFYIGFWESTGLVENEKNIWMHQPRSDFFRILQLNPFPFIKKPYTKGTKWQWSLEIGSGWGDARWKEWKGIIKNKYQYEITDTNSVVSSALGNLNCYKIESTAKSKLGKTYLISYFNEYYGFVKLDYTNIDGSKLILELNKVE